MRFVLEKYKKKRRKKNSNLLQCMLGSLWAMELLTWFVFFFLHIICFIMIFSLSSILPPFKWIKPLLVLLVLTVVVVACRFFRYFTLFALLFVFFFTMPLFNHANLINIINFRINVYRPSALRHIKFAQV